MKNITMIAAVGKNLELGKDNNLIWPIKEDLQFFKEQTTGKPVVMGMKTLESLRNKPLPNRTNIVLTRREPELDSRIVILHSKEELLEYAKEYGKEVMIIGGASIYKQLLDDAEKLILTEIDAEDKDADTYFPYFNKEEWESEVLSEHQEKDLKYKHLVYTRKR